MVPRLTWLRLIKLLYPRSVERHPGASNQIECCCQVTKSPTVYVPRGWRPLYEHQNDNRFRLTQISSWLECPHPRKLYTENRTANRLYLHPLYSSQLMMNVRLELGFWAWSSTIITSSSDSEIIAISPQFQDESTMSYPEHDMVHGYGWNIVWTLFPGCWQYDFWSH